MPYNNVISRSDAAALIPEDVSTAMIANLSTTSATLELSTHVPVSTNQTRFPLLAALPTAYFVGGDTGLKQTTKAAWDKQFINVEEIATIVPIPEAVLDDVDYDVWGTVQPLMEQAIGRTLDGATFFGVNKPGSWPAAIVPAAVTAGNVQARGASTKADGGIAQDINLLYGTVEGDGYDVTGAVGRTSFRPILRGARDTTGQPLADLTNGTLSGMAQLRWAMPGLWPSPGASVAELVVGDFTKSFVGVRKDMTYKLLDQAVITDADGNIVFNLAQQDMVAMRLVFRVGWTVANIINYESASGYPFGVLRSPAS